MSIQGSVNQAISVGNALYTQSDEYKNKQEAKAFNRKIENLSPALDKKAKVLQESASNFESMNESLSNIRAGAKNLANFEEVLANVQESKKHFQSYESKVEGIMDQAADVGIKNISDATKQNVSKMGNTAADTMAMGYDAFSKLEKMLNAKIAASKASAALIEKRKAKKLGV